MSRGWSRRALSLLPVVIACALPLPGLWQAAGPPMEEGFMLVFPERLLAGDLPNRDFLHLYGPGSLWVLAAVYWTVGTSLGAQRAVGYLQHLGVVFGRSEEHTSELQSQSNLVCRLLLEKKKKKKNTQIRMSKYHSEHIYLD